MKFAVLAADTALFTIRDNELLVRLIHVARPPHFPDNAGLPGGIIDAKETAEDAARRLIKSKAGIDPSKLYLEQLYTFDEVTRDPRGRVVAVCYLALVPWEKLLEAEKQDSAEAYWSPIGKARKLAYDHDDVLEVARKRLCSRTTYTTIIAKLMHREFTLTELEHAYQTILGKQLDKRNFRKKILKLGILKEISRKKREGAFRPAQLYAFASGKVEEIEVL